MAKTVPVSFSPSGNKNDGNQAQVDPIIEHQITPNQSQRDDSPNEGGDAGTKGTGSAG